MKTPKAVLERFGRTNHVYCTYTIYANRDETFSYTVRAKAKIQRERHGEYSTQREALDAAIEWASFAITQD